MNYSHMLTIRYRSIVAPYIDVCAHAWALLVTHPGADLW